MDLLVKQPWHCLAGLEPYAASLLLGLPSLSCGGEEEQRLGAVARSVGSDWLHLCMPLTGMSSAGVV